MVRTRVVRRAFNAVSFSFLFFFCIFFFFVEEASVVVPDDDGGREWWSKERKPAAGCLLKTTIQEVIFGSSLPRPRTNDYGVNNLSSIIVRLNLGPIRSIFRSYGTINRSNLETKVDRKVNSVYNKRTRTSNFVLINN